MLESSIFQQSQYFNFKIKAKLKRTSTHETQICSCYVVVSHHSTLPTCANFFSSLSIGERGRARKKKKAPACLACQRRDGSFPREESLSDTTPFNQLAIHLLCLECCVPLFTSLQPKTSMVSMMFLVSVLLLPWRAALWSMWLVWCNINQKWCSHNGICNLQACL